MPFVSIASVIFRQDGTGTEYHSRRVLRREIAANPYWWCLTIGERFRGRLEARGGAIFRSSGYDPEDPAVLDGLLWHLDGDRVLRKIFSQKSEWTYARFRLANPDAPLSPAGAIGLVQDNLLLFTLPIAGNA